MVQLLLFVLLKVSCLKLKLYLDKLLKENVKPVLFINKVDRLINELKLEPDELQKGSLTFYMEANKLIKIWLLKIKKEEWAVDFTDGSVAFGSAYHNWAINVPMMQETGVNFKRHH